MIQDIKDEILESSPSYTIRDKNGNVTQDDADIALKTPLIQEGTPINAAMLKNIQGDLYSQDRYNSVKTTAEDTGVIDINGKKVSSAISGVGELRSVVYGKGKYVAINDDGVAFTSTDRTTWEQHTISTSFVGRKIAYSEDEGIFVTVGNGGKIFTSPDAITWTSRTSGTSQPLYDVLYTEKGFVVIGQEGFIATSQDAITWTQRTSPETETFRSIAYGNGMCVIVGQNGRRLYSEDLITWGTSNDAGLSLWYTVAFGGGRFICGSSGKVAFSEDGINWSSKITLSIAVGNIYGIVIDSKQIVIGGVYGDICHSEDLSRWDVIKPAGTTETVALILNNGILETFFTSGGIHAFTEHKYDAYSELNLPLTSYEKNKIVNIRFSGEQRTENPIAGVYATSTYSDGNSPERAIDGNPNIAWSGTTTLGADTGIAQDRWYFELYYPIALNRMTIKLPANYIRYEIQGSNDTINWETLYVNSEQLIGTETREYIFENEKKFKYYGIAFYSSATSNRAAIYDVTAYDEEGERILGYVGENITKFSEIYLNINNLGAKKINGLLQDQGTYSLVYNGDSWDVVDDIVYGIYVGNTTTANTAQEVMLGFKPRLLIVGTYSHSSNMNAQGIMQMVTPNETSGYFIGTNTTQQYYTRVDNSGGYVEITGNGFKAYQGAGTNDQYGYNRSGVKYKYIAFR